MSGRREGHESSSCPVSRSTSTVPSQLLEQARLLRLLQPHIDNRGAHETFLSCLGAGTIEVCIIQILRESAERGVRKLTTGGGKGLQQLRGDRIGPRLLQQGLIIEGDGSRRWRCPASPREQGPLFDAFAVGLPGPGRKGARAAVRGRASVSPLRSGVSRDPSGEWGIHHAQTPSMP